MSVHNLNQFVAMLPILLPLLLAELALLAYCLVDIIRPERRVRGGNKLVWVLVVLLIGTLGPLAYLFWGREDM
ncbi:MAG: PLDc N-terminal domain-containing protein [Chloroflexota bacterium]|nr:PLDc N-terminal domain-containing protein [Chloroflexota bacterium]